MTKIKPYFHLTDPVALEAMSRGIDIALCREQVTNPPNWVEIGRKVMLSGRIVDAYPESDSYCRVRKRGWQYGKNDDKGVYNGDSETKDEEEFMKQPDDRRCPYCEAIWKKIPLQAVLNSRAAKKFGL